MDGFIEYIEPLERSQEYIARLRVRLRYQRE